MALAGLLLTSSPMSAHAETASGLNYFRSGQLAEAYQAWRVEADRGDASAALFIGVLYDTGLGVGRDASAALQWYLRAASGGNATAMFNAAVLFNVGTGQAPNPALAAEWYGRAAQNGHGRAEYNLAIMYATGTGVARNAGRAIQLFRAAAGHGVSAANMHLAQLGQRYARLVARTDDPAMRDFQKAEQVFLTRGPAKAIQAAALFRQAAEAGNPLAAYNLGYCYEHGIGVAADIPTAIAWYRRAAAQARDISVRTIADAGVRNLSGQITQVQR